MTNVLGKSISLGLGLLLYSREKIEKTVEELVNKGQVARKDARELVVELVKKGEEQGEELKNMIDSEIAKALNRMNIARKADLITEEKVREIVKEQVLQLMKEKETPGE